MGVRYVSRFRSLTLGSHVRYLGRLCIPSRAVDNLSTFNRSDKTRSSVAQHWLLLSHNDSAVTDTRQTQCDKDYGFRKHVGYCGSGLMAEWEMKLKLRRSEWQQSWQRTSHLPLSHDYWSCWIIDSEIQLARKGFILELFPPHDRGNSMTKMPMWLASGL